MATSAGPNSAAPAGGASRSVGLLPRQPDAHLNLRFVSGFEPAVNDGLIVHLRTVGHVPVSRGRRAAYAMHGASTLEAEMGGSRETAGRSEGLEAVSVLGAPRNSRRLITPSRPCPAARSCDDSSSTLDGEASVTIEVETREVIGRAVVVVPAATSAGVRRLFGWCRADRTRPQCGPFAPLEPSVAVAVERVEACCGVMSIVPLVPTAPRSLLTRTSSAVSTPRHSGRCPERPGRSAPLVRVMRPSRLCPCSGTATGRDSTWRASSRCAVAHLCPGFVFTKTVAVLL
jgi:hypothetical protein